MDSIKTNEYSIHLGENRYRALNQHIKSINPSKIVILTDTNTQQFCLEYFNLKLKVDCPIENISFPAGETFKNIATCSSIWKSFSEMTLDRKSLIINLGGGVVTDLGGFVASTYLRGLSYINIPTTLLSMVDASVGGKTGIDLDLLKNQIGLIVNPELVIIDTHFLKTLPVNEFNSGVAEIIKHGLIHSEEYWKIVTESKIINDASLIKTIRESILIKKEVVENDPKEQNQRKTLNFGHTLGHAIESHSHLKQDLKPLLHGEAVAIGLLLACYISNVELGFPKEKLRTLARIYSIYFKKTFFNEVEIETIIDLLKYDKKNLKGEANFVLLQDIGHYEIDKKVTKKLIYKAFEYYSGLE